MMQQQRHAIFLRQIGESGMENIERNGIAVGAGGWELSFHASGLLFVLPTDRAVRALRGHVPAHAMQPTGERPVDMLGRGFLRQREKHGLGRILGIRRVPQNGPADGQDHPAMAGNQLGKCLRLTALDKRRQ